MPKEKNTEYSGFRHPKSLGAQLAKLAELDGRTVADVIRRALREYVVSRSHEVES